jgi:hypothetical protein
LYLHCNSRGSIVLSYSVLWHSAVYQMLVLHRQHRQKMVPIFYWQGDRSNAVLGGE